MDTTQTDRKLRQRQEILNAVAHELGTPLTPMLLHIRQMEELAKTPEMERSVRVVARNTDRLVRRLRGIIKVTQLDSAHFPVSMQILPFSRIVKETVDEYRAAARSAGVRLELHQRTDVSVRADPDRMGEVIANLVDNAIRFSPSGTKVEVFTEDGPLQTHLRVKDRGVGFPPGDKEKMFEAFSQLANGLPHAYEGTGLGLFISKGIMELHGGDIEAYSAGPGTGATFTIGLPIARRMPMSIIWDEPEKEVEFYKRIKDLV